MPRQGSHRRFAAGSSAYRPQRRVADKQHDVKRQDAHEVERRAMAMARLQEACNQQQARHQGGEQLQPARQTQKAYRLSSAAPMGTFPAISTSNALIISEADCSTFSRNLTLSYSLAGC